MNFRTLAAAALVLACSATPQTARSQQPQANGGAVPIAKAADEDAAAIVKTASAFGEAFNRGDAKAIAALWTVNGEYVDEGGNEHVGRESIEKCYRDFFEANPGASLSLEVDAVRLISPGAAIEDGHAVMTSPTANETTRGAYTAVHAKVDGRWLMASVREARLDSGTAHEHIADLQWLIGTWTAEEQGGATESVCQWIGEKSFVERRYTTKAANGIETSGVQIIGWNAQTGRVQSWSFSADGSFAVGVWTPTEGGWQASVTGVTVAGATTSAINRLHRLDDNAYAWQSIDRSLDGRLLPDSDEVIMRRTLKK